MAKGKGREKVSFWKAGEEVTECAKQLIAKFNPMAVDANIAYIMRSKHAKRGDKVIWGSCIKQSDRAKLLHGYDYMVEISEDIFNSLSSNQKEALIAHEIMHIACEEDEQTGDVKFGLKQHDFSDFKAIVNHYGAYTSDLEELAKIIELRSVEEEVDKKKNVVKKNKVEEVKFDDEDSGIFEEK